MQIKYYSETFFLFPVLIYYSLSHLVSFWSTNSVLPSPCPKNRYCALLILQKKLSCKEYLQHGEGAKYHTFWNFLVNGTQYQSDEHKLHSRKKLVRLSLRPCNKLSPLSTPGCLVVSQQFHILHLVTPGYWVPKRKGVSLQLQAGSKICLFYTGKTHSSLPYQSYLVQDCFCDQYVNLKMQKKNTDKFISKPGVST